MDWTRLELSFDIAMEGELFSAERDTERTMSCGLENGTLDFSLLFDFAGKPPLHLRGAAAVGDKARIRLLPWRTAPSGITAAACVWSRRSFPMPRKARFWGNFRMPRAGVRRKMCSWETACPFPIRGSTISFT